MGKGASSGGPGRYSRKVGRTLHPSTAVVTGSDPERQDRSGRSSLPRKNSCRPVEHGGNYALPGDGCEWP